MTSRNDVPYWVNSPTSRRLWDAFQRILSGSPNVIKKSARMTPSSVSTEAGFQRSTLSKRRFPELTDLIAKNSGKASRKSITKLYDAKRALNRKLREKLGDANIERDVLLNRVVALELRHIALTTEFKKLMLSHGKSVVVPFKAGEESY